jgi:hypothetical protein
MWSYTGENAKFSIMLKKHIKIIFYRFDIYSFFIYN